MTNKPFYLFIYLSLTFSLIRKDMFWDTKKNIKDSAGWRSSQRYPNSMYHVSSIAIATGALILNPVLCKGCKYSFSISLKCSAEYQ